MGYSVDLQRTLKSKKWRAIVNGSVNLKEDFNAINTYNAGLS